MTPLQPGGRKPVRGPAIPAVLAFLLLLALCITPALAAGWTYLDPGAQPVLSARSEGETRYYPGDSFELTVMLANRAKDTSMQVAPLLAPGIYDPSAALGVTVIASAGDAPVTIKSLPLTVGNIGSLSTAPVTIRGTIRQNATPGIYTIPLNVEYQYVYAIPMVGADFNTVNMLYRTKNQTLHAALRVREEVRPEIISENATNLVPGSQGYLTTTVQNIGYATGSDVAFGIIPADNATFQMVDQSIWVGKFGPGNTTELRARIAIRDHTGAGSYPAVLVGQYRDADGIFRSTPQVQLGIPVAQGALFSIADRNVTITPGGQKTIRVTYTNTGDAVARQAAARIVGNQVLVPVSDTFALGDLTPGESRTATFVVSTDSAVAGKQYVVNTEVKYRDGLDALMLSDQLSLGVLVENPTGIAAITQNPVALIVIAGIIVILAYAAYELRKRRRAGQQ